MKDEIREAFEARYAEHIKKLGDTFTDLQYSPFKAGYKSATAKSAERIEELEDSNPSLRLLEKLNKKLSSENHIMREALDEGCSLLSAGTLSSYGQEMLLSLLTEALQKIDPAKSV